MMSKEIGKGSWDSIVRRYQEVYPSKEPFHYGTIKRWREGGSAPLDGNSVYDAGEFWHYLLLGWASYTKKMRKIPV